MAQILTDQDFQNAKIDIDDIGESVNTDAVITPRYGSPFNSVPRAIRLLMETGGWKAYETEVALLATTPTVNPSVGYAFDTKKLYKWDGVSWIDEGLSQLDQAKAYADQADNLKLQQTRHNKFVSTTNPVIPMVTDHTGRNVLLGFDSDDGVIVGSGLVNDINKKEKVNVVQANTGYREFKNDDAPILPIISDISETRVLFGYDTETGELVGNFKQNTLNKKNLTESINMVIFGGQSLSMGTSSTPMLSVVSKYSNALMFDNGKFATSGSTAFVPLVEVEDSANSLYESPLSGFANYALTRANQNNGIEINNHKLLMSCSGRGGSPIEWHIKGGTVYENYLIPQIKNAVKVNPNIAVRAFCWMHGENSASNGMSKEVYYNYIRSIIKDLNSDVSLFTQQDKPIRMITYQTSAVSKTSPFVAFAQTQLVKDGLADFASPVYRFEHCTADSVHLSAEGSKLAGAYFARAYLQRVIECRDPDWLEPLSAVIVGDTVRVKFKTPKLPLRFETVELPAVTNNGFAVRMNDVDAVISSITIDQDTVLIKLSASPTGVVKVRYALDHSSSTYNNYTESGVGNLVDSTSEVVNINSKNFTLFHCAPHFELTAQSTEI